MTVVATIWCGACADEKRRKPGKLGEVVELPGCLLWHGYHPPSAKRLRNIDALTILSTIEVGETLRAMHYWQDLTAEDAPERLPVWCRYHGAGTLSTDDVRKARGRVPVNFVAAG